MNPFDSNNPSNPFYGPPQNVQNYYQNYYPPQPDYNNPYNMPPQNNPNNPYNMPAPNYNMPPPNYNMPYNMPPPNYNMPPPNYNMPPPNYNPFNMPMGNNPPTNQPNPIENPMNFMGPGPFPVNLLPENVDDKVRKLLEPDSDSKDDSDMIAKLLGPSGNDTTDKAKSLLGDVKPAQKYPNIELLSLAEDNNPKINMLLQSKKDDKNIEKKADMLLNPAAYTKLIDFLIVLD